MSKNDRTKNIEAYLKSLDVEGLNELLGQVLAEMRLREGHQMKTDILVHSRKLPRLKQEKPTLE